MLAMFTHKDSLVISTLPDIFWNRWYEIHKHVAPVSNRAVIGSLLRGLTAKFESFSLAYSV